MPNMRDDREFDGAIDVAVLDGDMPDALAPPARVARDAKLFARGTRRKAPPHLVGKMKHVAGTGGATTERESRGAHGASAPGPHDTHRAKVSCHDLLSSCHRTRCAVKDMLRRLTRAA